MAKKKGDPKIISPAKWQDIKQGFITQCKSHAELAEEFGVSATAISVKSSKEKWVEERSLYWLSIERELSDLVRKDMIESRKNLLKTGIYFFGKGVQHLQEELKEADKKKVKLSNKEAWEYFNKGVEIIKIFMERENDLNLRFPQAGDSEVLNFLKGEFKLIHGDTTIENNKS